MSELSNATNIVFFYETLFIVLHVSASGITQMSQESTQYLYILCRVQEVLIEVTTWTTSFTERWGSLQSY